ncbi:hypothetical protein [Endozoicomonas sp. 2B-B]
MSVICLAKPLNGGFIVELDRPDSYEMETPPVESTSLQWPYVRNLLVAYELILTPKDKPLSAIPYSLEAAIVGWLLKSSWNRDSPLFNPIEQQEVSQNHPFAVTITVPGSEQDQPQGQPPESSGQQAIQFTTHPLGYLTHLLYSDSGKGNEEPQQHSHTLGLNCFVHPCNGVCRFRQSSGLTDGKVQNCEESSTDKTGKTSEKSFSQHLARRHCYRCNSLDGVASDGVASDGVASASIATVTDAINTTAGRLACNVIVFEKDGHLRQCGKVCKNEKRLSCHKSKCHTGEKTCDVMVTGEDNQSQPCGTFFKNAGALSVHKARVHGNQRICKLTILGKGRQLRPCEKVFKNNRSFATHKYKFHTGQKTCDLMVTGEGSQQRPCGAVCKNAQDLMIHKRNGHTKQASCDLIVVSEDGQKRSCAFVGKNPQALWSHRSKIHSGKRTCDVTVIGENGQQQSCAKVCRNAGALTDHKRIDHSGQQTCYYTVVGEGGQRWPCGKICKNTKALLDHKRAHRKHKTFDMNQHVDQGSQKSKVKK